MVPLPRNISASAGLLGALLLLGGCAGQIPPPGGPKDTVPPGVIRTSPDSNATGISPKSVTLEFSKYVDRRSVEESIFISPYAGDLTYDWSGREVTFTFGSPLRRNTTYVISVGTDVADVREGNRMASAFALAFSTGDSIDRGFLTGRVFDEKPEGVMIFAYKLEGILGDTLDPARVRPDYLTQTGKAGAFSLVHLAYGPYRVFAVRDEYHNLLYDRQVDQFGVAASDFRLTPESPGAREIGFRLSREDTSRPFIAGVRALDRRRVSVRFSEPLDSLSFVRGTFIVTDTVSSREVPLALVSPDAARPAVATLLTTIPLDSPAVYRVRVRGVADTAGNPIDEGAAAETFEGTVAPDTLRPAIGVVGMKDSVRAVDLLPRIEVRFTDPVIPFRLDRAVALRDSTGRMVPSSGGWTGHASFALAPRSPLEPMAWYALRVTMDSVRSFTGRGYRDSTFALRFETLDPRRTGSIRGTVEDPRAGEGGVVVTASSVDLAPAHLATVRLGSPGPFRLEQLPEGKYALGAYREGSVQGRFDFGRPAPFRPSSRFTFFADTLRVRARWGVEGVLLKLP